MIRIRENVNVGETGEPVIDPKVHPRLQTLNGKVVIGIVGVASNLAERLG